MRTTATRLAGLALLLALSACGNTEGGGGAATDVVSAEDSKPAAPPPADPWCLAACKADPAIVAALEKTGCAGATCCDALAGSGVYECACTLAGECEVFLPLR